MIKGQGKETENLFAIKNDDMSWMYNLLNNHYFHNGEYAEIQYYPDIDSFYIVNDNDNEKIKVSNYKNAINIFNQKNTKREEIDNKKANEISNIKQVLKELFNEEVKTLKAGSNSGAYHQYININGHEIVNEKIEW